MPGPLDTPAPRVPTADVRVLSCHAGYRCGRSGRCCSSGWPIPVETEILARLGRAGESGRLQPAEPGVTMARAFDVPAGAPPGSPVVLAARRGRCVFVHGEAPTACAIHDALGHEALPLACRQFPRVAVTDPRGVSVTLSHYCPTARRLLDAAGSVAIVTNAPGFPPAGEYVGLDAAVSLPPLLHAELLMDWASWWRVEAHGVDLLANGAGDAGTRVARLSAAVERLRGWTPAAGPLGPAVERAFDGRSTAPGVPDIDIQARVAEVLATLPPDLADQLPGPDGSPITDDPSLGVFLATHAFASWTPHLGRGLRTWVRGVEAAYAFAAAGYGLATVDLALRHLADPAALARAWSAAETTPRP